MLSKKNEDLIIVCGTYILNLTFGIMSNGAVGNPIVAFSSGLERLTETEHTELKYNPFIKAYELAGIGSCVYSIGQNLVNIYDGLINHNPNTLQFVPRNLIGITLSYFMIEQLYPRVKNFVKEKKVNLK